MMGDSIRVAKQLSEPNSEAKQETPTERNREKQKFPTSLEWGRKGTVLLFVSMATLYLLIALVRYLHGPPGIGQHFVYLADGWLHGHLYVHDLPHDTQDFTLHNGHWYVAFPPLPAVLMLPLVAIFHLANPPLITFSLSVGMGILNLGLMLWVLKRFSYSQFVGQKLIPVAWLLGLFAFGSEHLYAVMQGHVWELAHIVATTFLLLYIGETLGKRRPLVAGLFLGLAVLSRTTVLFTFPFFVLLAMKTEHMRPLKVWLPGVLKQLVPFFAMLGLFVVGMLIYNKARFGSFTDFGYTGMNVNPYVSGGLHKYGLFSLHFLPTNFRYMLLEPPKLISSVPYLIFSTHGTGIFWTTPALLFAFLAFRSPERRWLAGALLVASLLPMALLLLYFNTGWLQFGYRFSLDFLPFALLLAALGMQQVPAWREKALIVLSVFMNVWGLFVFMFFHLPLL